MYVAQLLPDKAGATLLRRLLLDAITSGTLTGEEEDAAHELYAKLSKDMRKSDAR